MNPKGPTPSGPAFAFGSHEVTVQMSSEAVGLFPFPAELAAVVEELFTALEEFSMELFEVDGGHFFAFIAAIISLKYLFSPLSSAFNELIFFSRPAISNAKLKHVGLEFNGCLRPLDANRFSTAVNITRYELISSFKLAMILFTRASSALSRSQFQSGPFRSSGGGNMEFRKA
jgi:hypothetical protein